MPLHIKDETATEAVRRLAQARKITLTEAVREACAEALERDKSRVRLADRLAPLFERLDALPRTGPELDKAFFDAEWGDDET
jgi:antitoxin VapB